MSERRQEPCKLGMSEGMITQRGNHIIESDGEDSRLNSFFHNLSDAIDIQSHLE